MPEEARLRTDAVLGLPRRLEDDVLDRDELQRAVVPLLVDERLGPGRVERRVVERGGGRRIVEQADVHHVDAHRACGRVVEVGDARVAGRVGQLERVPGVLGGAEVVERRRGVTHVRELGLASRGRVAGHGQQGNRCGERDQQCLAHVSPPFQAATGAGSGLTSTVSATFTISSTGRSAAEAWRLIASGLDAW